MMLQDRRWGAVLRSAFWRASPGRAVFRRFQSRRLGVHPPVYHARQLGRKVDLESVPRKADVVCAVFGQSKPGALRLHR